MLTENDVRSMTKEEMIEYMRANLDPMPDQSPLEEVEDALLRSRLLRNLPCPAIKRDGEVCGSHRVSVSGYCFAHDPEAAGWRAMGGRAKAKRVRARKKLKELGLDHMTESLEEVFDELRSGHVAPAEARAMARIATTVMKLTEWAAELDTDSQPPKNGGWMPYEP